MSTHHMDLEVPYHEPESKCFLIEQIIRHKFDVSAYYFDKCLNKVSEYIKTDIEEAKAKNCEDTRMQQLLNSVSNPFQLPTSTVVL